MVETFGIQAEQVGTAAIAIGIYNLVERHDFDQNLVSDAESRIARDEFFGSLSGERIATGLSVDPVKRHGRGASTDTSIHINVLRTLSEECRHQVGICVYVDAARTAFMKQGSIAAVDRMMRTDVQIGRLANAQLLEKRNEHQILAMLRVGQVPVPLIGMPPKLLSVAGLSLADCVNLGFDVNEPVPQFGDHLLFLPSR